MADEQIGIDQSQGRAGRGINSNLRLLKEIAEAEIAANRQAARALCERCIPEELNRLSAERREAFKTGDFLALLELHLPLALPGAGRDAPQAAERVQHLSADKTRLEAELQRLEAENAALRNRLLIADTRRLETATAIERNPPSALDEPTALDMLADPDPLSDTEPTDATHHMTYSVVDVRESETEEPTDAEESQGRATVQADTPDVTDQMPPGAFPAGDSHTDASAEPHLLALQCIASGEYRLDVIRSQVAGNQDLLAALAAFTVPHRVRLPHATYLLGLNSAGRAELKAKCGLDAPGGYLDRLLAHHGSADTAHAVLWALDHLSEADPFPAQLVADFKPGLVAPEVGPVLVWAEAPPLDGLIAALRANGDRLCVITLTQQTSRAVISRFTQASEDEGRDLELCLTHVSALISRTFNTKDGSIWLTRQKTGSRR